MIPEFKPQWTARKGAQELYETFKNTDLTLEDFEGPKYKRISHIRKLIDEGKLDNSLFWSAGI